MNQRSEEDWAVIDTPFEYTKAQVNAWGVVGRPERDRYICRVETNPDAGWTELSYLAPDEFYDPALVKMYPQIWTGDKFGNAPTGHPSFPVRLGSIDKINVDMTCQERNIMPGTIRNIAFEAFFHSGLPITGPGHPSGQSNKVYELMVWFQNPDGGVIPSNRTAGRVTVNGVQFDTYVKDAYIAFLAVEPIRTVKQFDFMEFVHETNVLAMDGLADQINADWQISALEMGAEVWRGEGTLRIEEFNVELELFEMMNDSQPDSGIVTPVQMQSGIVNLMERCAHNHRLIAERNYDIANDYDSFAKALKNEN